MNALQHAFDDDTAAAQISIRVTRPREGRIGIDFSDNGRGIDAHSLPRVFDPFFTPRRGTGGTVLGLHLASNLVTQLLGGPIPVPTRQGAVARSPFSLPHAHKT